MQLTQKKTSLLYIGLGILLCAGAVGVWWYSAHRSSGNLILPTLAPTSVTYTSEEDGVSFAYPSSYALETHILDVAGMHGKYLTLTPKNGDLPTAGEGPPGITVEIFENPKHLPLGTWLQTITNGTPAPAQGFDYADMKVGGEDATVYSATGLYESDNVAVSHGAHVYVFSASWVSREDATLTDLKALLTSVHFTN